MSGAGEFWRDPALPWIESRRACSALTCYRLHSHPGFSIGAVDEGVSRFTGAPQGPVLIGPGTLVLLPPFTPHACNPQSGRWGYQMMHLDAGWVRAVGGRTPLIWEDQVIGLLEDPERYQWFCELNDVLFSAAEPAEKEAAVRRFVIGRTRATRVAAGSDPVAEVLLRPVFEALEGGVPVGLDELADIAGLSKSHLIRAFKAATGMTPIAWQLNRRVIAARGALREGEPLADLAHRLGFADQPHFTRVFKAHAGTTPGRYRR